LAHDIAIYDIIVESLIWSRIGNIICLFALAISLQGDQLLSSVFAKTTGKEKNETKRLQAYLELKMTVKTVNEVTFLSCTSLIVYIELHSSVFFLV